MAINQAWVTLVMLAQDLLAWTQHLYLDGDLAIAEPKRLRYCLLHAAGMIVHTGRQTKLRLADDCPWTDALIAAFDRLHHRPARC